jgi:hypothetical protein
MHHPYSQVIVVNLDHSSLDDNTIIQIFNNKVKDAAFSLMQQGALPSNITLIFLTENFPHFAQPGNKIPVMNCDATITSLKHEFQHAHSRFLNTTTISLKEVQYQ